MKLSRRAKRMQRHYKRMHNTGGLNLVSLMDIFTILVFFLMVNSSDVKVLQQDKSVELPLSVAEKQPSENLVITVSGDNILVQGRTVATVSSVAQGKDGEIIEGLKQELEYQSQRSTLRDNPDFAGFPATLVADKTTPYRVLKQIMSTCTAAQYTQLSLAVSKKAKPEGA